MKLKRFVTLLLPSIYLLKILLAKRLFLKKIVTVILANLVTNLLLYLFCPFVKSKNKNQIFSKLVVW